MAKQPGPYAPNDPNQGIKDALKPKHRPRADRRQSRRLARSIKKKGSMGLSPAVVERLTNTVSKSKDMGTFNRGDRQVLRRALRQINGIDGMNQSNMNTLGILDDVTRLQGMAYPKSRQATGNTNGMRGDKIKDLIADGAKPHEQDRFDTHYGPHTKGPKGNAGRPPVGNQQGRGGNGRGGRGGGGRGVKGMVYYGLGEFPGVDRKQAQLVVGQDINRQVRELLNSGRQMKEGMQYDVNQANALHNRTEGDLDYIFKNVQDVNSHNSGIIDQRFQNTEGQLQQLFGALQGQMQGNTDSNKAAAMQEMARLGIQQTGMGNYDQDAAWSQNMAATNQANTMANTQAMQDSAAQVGAMLQSMSAGSLASAVGRSLNDRNDAISDTRQGYRGNMNDILGTINDVRGQRGSMVNELYNTMEQNAYQRWAETQQADFNNNLAANQFNLGVAKLNSDNLLSKAELRQEAARQAALRRNQNRLFNQMQNTGKSIDTDLAQLFGQA